jgi:phosphoenolpyruvate carboxykinase (GTP)
MIPKRLLLVEDDRALAELVSFHFDRAGWQAEFESLAGFLNEFGDRLPDALHDEHARIANELQAS